MKIEFEKLAELINYIPSDVLAKLLTVDGANSGLDADKVDGLHASAFLLAATYTAADILTKLKTVDGPNSGLDADTLDGTELSAINSAIAAKLNSSVYTAADILSKLLTVDGANSGLDADLLDSHEANYFLPAASYTAADILAKLMTVDGPDSGLNADLFDNLNSDKFMYVDSTVIPASTDLNNYIVTGIYYQNLNTSASSGTNYPTAKAGILEVINVGSFIYQRYTTFAESSSAGANGYTRAYFNGTWTNWKTNWNNGNDGAGSGLDADLLDGNHASAFLLATAYNAADVLSKLLTVDGHLSGLDADKLDGNEASAFLLNSNYIEASNFNDGTGYIKFKNGLQICWGVANITPVANTPTIGEVTFPRAFNTNIPLVIAGMSSTVPGTIWTGISTGTITLTGVDLYVTRVNTTVCSCRYIAIGK